MVYGDVMNTRTVGQIAKLSGLTVRTLHHYDDIGLLTPSERGDNGYRRYTDGDLERLRQILVYRELGLGLDEIASIVDREVDPSEALLAERRHISDRIERLRAIAEMIDATVETQRKGMTMTPEEKLSVFGDFDPAEYEEEAKERWGDTDAYAQSVRRTSSYTKADWENINDEADGIYDRFVGLMDAGNAPGDAQTAKVVDAHRAHISRWFYECSPEIHAGLGVMYVQDPRFTENIDKHGTGLAQYMSDAIADRYSR
jgi:DNA-binding transcriptional MerR regulator